MRRVLSESARFDATLTAVVVLPTPPLIGYSKRAASQASLHGRVIYGFLANLSASQPPGQDFNIGST